jgi:MtfA peptidase
MGDTLYLEDGTVVYYDTLGTDTKLIIEQLQKDASAEVRGERPDYGWTPFVVVMTSLVALGFFAVRRSWKAKGTEILGSWEGDPRPTVYDLFSTEKYRDADEKFREQTKGYLVYHGHDIKVAPEQYDKILSRHCHYYRRLAPELKERFIQRVKKFLESKIFLIKTKQPFVDMPVLLSASAVQLSFGLDKYLLPHYEYIRILPKEYMPSDRRDVLLGHVAGNTITIAWSHFLEGQEDHSDGVNLGLHEMAHALYFQLTEATFGRCDEFTANFETVMSEGKEVHQLKGQHASDLFNENAYRNLQEFWAESVELFFERPADLRREYPDVYASLKNILKQDPVQELYPIVS